MKLTISRDYLNNPIPPRVFLCTTGKKRMGELPATNRQLHAKWNQYGEFSFETQRTYVDLIDGETKVHPLYDKVEAPRNILVENVAFFALQDIDDTSSDNDIKSVSAFSLEYATSNKYLTNWHINTGEVDSKEVLYNESLYGIDYNTDTDSFYKLASGEFDPYESYYQQNYTNTDSYVYEQVQVRDAQDYETLTSKNDDPDAQPHEKLYMKKFANVQFYNPNKQGLSLLHLIFENVPEWKIGNVDQSLWRKERKFSEDRTNIYDFIQNNLHDTFNCVAAWDSIAGLVHFYEELEDDEGGVDNEASTRFETDVFISKKNLASECVVKYSSDDIKTKLTVTGSDDLGIREVNIGRNEIMDLSFYHTLDWMEPDLYEAYDRYLDALAEADTGFDKYGLISRKYPMSYNAAMKGWIAANNRYTDLMNAVPAEGNVVLVGDEFKKLYCTYSPLNTAYCKSTINIGTRYVEVSDVFLDEKYTRPVSTPTKADTYVVQGALLTYDTKEKKFKVDFEWGSKKNALIKQLNQYHIDEDTKANKQDNILLKLKNASSDIATIRIYNKGAASDTGENDYHIQSMITYASSGTSGVAKTYPIIDWIKGELTAESMDLQGYKITYIGTMGAYFVLAKDEKIPDNLQDYGIRLLEEKHKTYTTIFQTQTEAMFSKENAQCIVQDDIPEGEYKDGTRWLDTNSNPVVLHEYRESSGTWVAISGEVSESDRMDYENYQRYIDNYEKLKAVQQVLTEKKYEAEYSLDGHPISDMSIMPLLMDDSTLETNMHNAALSHFKGYSVIKASIDKSLPLYTFVTSADPIIYGENTKPYNYFEQYYIKKNYLPTFVRDKETFDSYDGSSPDKTLYVAISQNPTVYKKNTDPYDSFVQYYITNKIPNIYLPITIDGADMFNRYDGSIEEKTLYVIASGHSYVVYLKDTVPYVAYANSQGVYDIIMQYIRNNTEMNKFFTVDQWIRLSPFIKEDEFNDPNFFLTEYDSEEEKNRITKELMETAAKKLKTLCKPSLEFSMTMANILALPEFEPIFDQFQLGNFIKVGIRDDYVKRARLLEADINFDDLSNFSCTFGNLITAKSEIDKHADLLKTAVTAGKQVAKASGNWQRAVDKTNKLEEDIENGLKDSALLIGTASGQAISWDSTGMHFRKYKEGSTTEYEPEEIAIINNALVATNDSWQTSKASFGKYYINGEERWGPIAEYITAQTIEGKFITGGSMKIGGTGGTFIVNEDGSVEILGPDASTSVYATKDDIDSINQGNRYYIELEYTGSTIFTEPGQSCTIKCKVLNSGTEITNLPTGTVFKWIRNSSVDDATWNATHTYTDINTITITNADIERNAQFYCQCTIDETKLS